MKLLEELLLETRRIYKRLPNLDSFKELEKYKDKDDYYISFTNLEKIGVNPQSSFRTPLGIYMYPLKEAWENYEIEKNKSVKQSVPFAGERPNIYVVKLKPNIKFVKKASDYTSSDLERDLKILKEHALANKERFYKSFYREKPEQLTEKVIDDKFKFWKLGAKLDYDVSALWNITRNMAFRGREDTTSFSPERRSVITNWNTLFYKVLGYYGFADKEGTGYIHSSEKTQAVFFTKLAFDVVSLVPNKELNGTESSWFIKGINKKEIKVKNTKTKYDGKENELHWHNGIWISGTWENGWWLRGTWESGTWLKGYWFNGTWKGGTWKNGIWKSGTWENGTWEDGTWEDGTWEGGTWKDGIWMKGVWEGGVWEDGTWLKGTWEGGTWRGGKIYDKGRIGNFKPDWKWLPNGCVESPISPAEYWKDK
jgi:hypothetical protein